jgi:ankyrin repeat protein
MHLKNSFSHSVPPIYRLLENRCMSKKSDASAQLFLAAENNRPEMIEVALAKKGTRVNAREMSFGMTALHVASSKGHAEVVQALIDNGSDIEAREETGRTPLHTAAFRGQKEIVELLLKNGAEINARTRDGKTPLDWAIVSENIALANLLRQRGARTAVELDPPAMGAAPENS